MTRKVPTETEIELAYLAVLAEVWADYQQSAEVRYASLLEQAELLAADLADAHGARQRLARQRRAIHRAREQLLDGCPLELVHAILKLQLKGD